MKKNIKICVDNIIIGTRYEDTEEFYPLNVNDGHMLDILDTIFSIPAYCFEYIRFLSTIAYSILSMFL